MPVRVVWVAQRARRIADVKIVSVVAAAAAALALSAAAQAESLRVAQAPYVPPPPSLSGPGGVASPGRPILPETGPGTPTYESDGNSRTPRALNSPDVPAYQQGSGQETGGPARELIPRR